MSRKELYEDAARALLAVDERSTSLKSAALHPSVRNKPATFALVSEAYKRLDVLKRVCDTVRIVELEPTLTSSLAWILVFDMLFGMGLDESHSGKESLAVLRHAAALKAALADLGASGVHFKAETPTHPQYIRVNTLKCSVRRAERAFPLARRDGDVPALLVLRQREKNLFAHSMVGHGQLILQDKGSCLPALALSPPAGAVVLDCCAAPGNKTTHLAALMQNQGLLYACERDVRRAALLAKRVASAGASCVQILVRDFAQLSENDADMLAIEFLLLDPTCSGSGLATRPELGVGVSDAASCPHHLKGRVRELAETQLELLKHALAFPHARRVVYSTCSVFREENEDVIVHALSLFPEYRPLNVLSTWKRRGLRTEFGSRDIGPLFLRTNPWVDGTNGFFVAALERCCSE